MDEENNWFDAPNGEKRNFYFDEMPFFFINAQRDILEDIKTKSSFLGKMLSQVEYSSEDIKKIEEQIKELNELAVDNSSVLSQIKKTLQEINSASGDGQQKIEVTPFTKRVRDLNKGLSIYYSDNGNSLSMEYHGMGTRSWSSLLTLKAFTSLLNRKAQGVFFPILAIEEPEAHLHPNAQKQLYQQISTMEGQKIISTHSQFIASMAEIGQIRSLHKGDIVRCGKIGLDKLSDKEIRKIERRIIESKGEILFANVLIFFEGETENQALPIFFKEYFKQYPYEMGINFVSVDGKKSYSPFLNFAKSLNIPWIIFSDGEDDTIEEIRKKVDSSEENLVVFLDDGNNFEQQIIQDGFEDEAKEAAKSLKLWREGSNILKIMETKKNKVEMGHMVAIKIIESEKDIPAKVKELFNKIENILNIKRRK